MIQLTINAESIDKKGILETLEHVIKEIKNESSGDFDDERNLSWWLEDLDD